MTVEPTRLIDDAATAGALKGDLAVAAAARVEGVDFSAGLAQLQTAIGAETGAIPAVGQATGSLAPKLAVGAVAVAVAAWFGLREPTPPPSPQMPVAVATPQPEPEELSDGHDLIEPEAEPEPLVDEVPEVAPVPDEEPEATAQPEPTAEPESQPQPGPETAPAHVAKPKTHRDKTDATAKPDPHRTLQEAKAVQAARRALATNPADALEQAKQIAKDFPKGQLVEERRAIEIQALAKLGRDDEARTKAEAFLAKHGRGPHAAAVRRATGL